MIRMSGLTLRRENRVILNGVDLHIGKDEHWVILGRNGSGKTTLLEMMTGYMFPTSGTVEVLGYRYGQCDVREVRKRIGYISQSLIEKLTLADPVWEVVATGEYAFLRFYQDIPSELKDKACSLLGEVGLGEMAEQPFGTLSQGERKKALLARALMADPALLIMDEPCAGLDLFEREKLLAQLDRLGSRNMTLVYVTHHMEEIVPVFTHVALIHNGSLIAAGPKQDVLTPERLAAAYELPVEVEWAYGRPWLKVPSGEEVRR
ncbi:ATP-binding cassette domain-containing protein [Paenibacillus cisolokensis]|uniref:ABC transporter ATP-binding protein YlmA n=1 Tax=Paenibacillus cisolokensis TaxID=1658519 RepID=A0ABQ4N5K5_9BACL|nr:MULTISPECIES: ATP-binding cassette domain-containing protein [Paenibacillus]ALS27945.1 molybdenum ABC transporter ATP-binding protein [Paenibacillus sp. 32O-W]GIQ63226.1 putative ABC transporter ATP-binding protein YlmA [Paenibacillus cisolokensis]